MVSRMKLAVALWTLAYCVSLSPAEAAVKSVGTLTDDTFIGFDSNATPLPEETVQGAEADITVREGTSETSLTAKPLFKFDLTEAIDPSLPYFLEVSTGTDGASNATFSVFSISDPALQAILDEDTLTWNIAAASAPNAVISRDSFEESGTLVGNFVAPGFANTAIVVPISGTNLQTFGEGLGSTAFGITSSTNSTMNFTSKEAAAGVGQARIFTFDTIDSNGTGGGALNTAATWSDNAVPVTDNFYRVISGDTVTADGSGGNFAGSGLIAASGATVDFSANAEDQSNLIVQAGGELTHSSSGNFFLGNINDPGSITVDGTATFNPTANSDIFIDMNVSGEGNIVVNSNGASSSFFPSFTSGFIGTISFNGDGDEVEYTEPNSGIDGRLEMNSTGSNTLALNADRTGGGTTAFNQPGTIDHRSTVDRLAGTAIIEANATVTADLTKTFSGNERRLFIGQTLQGSGDIIVNGTATNPTAAPVSLNEFEVGGTDEGGDGLSQSTYSGTLSTNGFVNVELRSEFLDAKVVISENAVLDVGHRNINDGFAHRIGEIEVASGGTLNVGYENSTNAGDPEHGTLELVMSAAGTMNGDLTMDSGSTLQIQISGGAPNDFDRILVEGTADLAAEIVVITNPLLPSQEDTVTDAPYVPTLGDTFDIIIASNGGGSADFDGSGTVDGSDLTDWQAAFGTDDGGDANGDGDSDGSDFLTWQTQLGTSPAAGTIIDSGITFSLDDSATGTTFAGTGLQFQLNVSSTLVQLEVVAATAVAAVPEPTSCAIASLGLLLLASRRIRNF